jgi:AMP deaminase
MLGFNPKDHDGHFSGLDSHLADVSGTRPDVDPTSVPTPESPFAPWRIYPRPPPPHWHWSDKAIVPHNPDEHSEEDFEFETCEIPGSDYRDFQIDERGVYQVYDNLEGEFHCLCCLDPKRLMVRRVYSA